MNDRPHLPANANILVTGATGFIGAYVVRDLILAGYRVRAMRRKNSIPSWIDRNIMERAEWMQGDILDVANMDVYFNGIDAVVHAAASVSFAPRDVRLLFRTNVEGTANIVNAAIDYGVKKFLYVSSVGAIGRTAGQGAIDESRKWESDKQQSNYGVSKYEGEIEVWRGIGEGLNAVIVNPATVLGYGNWDETSCAIFKNIYNGFPWYSEGLNGFVGVEDVSRIIVRLLQSDISAERFILSAEVRSYVSVFNAIADGFRKRRPYRKATPLLAAFAWRLEKLRTAIKGVPPRVTRETARIAMSENLYSNRKILSVLGDFSFENIETIISDACGKYLQQHHTV
jgi:dihydroflavonol-4-reductase